MGKISPEFIVSEALARLAGSTGIGRSLDQGMDEIAFTDLDYFELPRPVPVRYNLVDRIKMVGMDIDAARRGEIIRVEHGEAWAEFDPYGMNGFLLRAGASVAGGVVDIGFDTNGNIVRSVVNFRIVRGEDAVALWLMASRMKC